MGPELTLSLRIGKIQADLVPRSVMEAVTEVNVRTAASGPSGFDLKFAVSTQSPIVTSLLPDGFFDPPSRVIISVTLRGTETVLIDGVITHHEMSASDEPGKSVLSIKGDDLTRMMDLVDLSFLPYPAMPTEARIALMIAKYAPIYGIIPLIVPSLFLDVPNPLQEIPSQQGTDLAYIKSLADLVGYTFYLQAGPTPGLSMAYWGPPLRTAIPFLSTPPPMYIDWDAHSNVESLGFSFDGFAATLWLLWIQEPTTNLILPIPIPNVNPLSPPLASKLPLPLKIKAMQGAEQFSSSPVQALAVGLAAAAAGANVVSGQGSLDVSHYGAILPARCIVEVNGAGVTYDGQYFVDSVSHSIKPGSYKQNFTLSRNALVAGGAAGPFAGLPAPQQLGGFADPSIAPSPLTPAAQASAALLPPLVGPGASVSNPIAPAPPNSLTQSAGRVATLPASPNR